MPNFRNVYKQEMGFEKGYLVFWGAYRDMGSGNKKMVLVRHLMTRGVFRYLYTFSHFGTPQKTLWQIAFYGELRRSGKSPGRTYL